MPAILQPQSNSPHTPSPAAPQRDIAWLKSRLIEAAAARCAENGWRRIALYGAGRHTLPIIRQPWREHDIQVVAVLDDDPHAARLRGVPVLRPSELAEPIDAIVISSDAHERSLFERACAVFAPGNISILRIYGDPFAANQEDEATIARLVRHWGLSEADARWLVANRAERHDATLPMLPGPRTELHLRRYEFAAAHVAGLRVLDAACGTGYGTKLLRTLGNAEHVTGVDIDPAATAYAQRRHAAPAVRFITASATETGLPDASVDAVVSFETIEHIQDCEGLIEEFARVLNPRGRLILSTPNDAGLTDHHVHSFTRESLGSLLSRRFTRLEWFGQRADAPLAAEPAAGIERFDELVGGAKPDYLIVCAQRAR